MSSRLAVLLAVLGACSELPDYEPNTCGNFALEVGEDCDNDSASCVECKLQCDVSAEVVGSSCSAVGYVCGVDGFCHAPSGVFLAGGSYQAFRARELMITNVDSDGIGDVVGLATNAISVHHGDPSGVLASSYSILTPQVRGFPAFVRLDNNDSLDVLVPTADGIAGYSSPEGYLAPHPFAFDLTVVPGCPYSLDDNQPFTVFSLNDRYLGTLTANSVTNVLGLAVIDTTQKSVCPTQLPLLCTDLAVGNPNTMPPDLDVYPTAIPNASPGKVIAVRAAGGLCVVHARETGSADAPFAFTDITPNRYLGGRPALADLSGTGCPSLVVMGQGALGSMREYLGSDLGGDCKLATGFTDLPLDPGEAVAIGHLELAPRLPGYGKDAVVMSSGVFAVHDSRATVVPLYQSDRPLTFVQSGDIDRDGDLDGVAISASLVAGSEDIDVLARTTAGGFLLRRIDTEEPIATFVVGDYDGDEVADIAYTEKISASNERLSIVFGTRDLPLPATVFGAFTKVVGLCPMQVDDSIDRQDVITDLLVLDLTGPGGGEPSQFTNPAFTLLHGSPQRTLQSFIDPRTDPDPVIPSVFGGVAAGNFFGSTSIDVVAFEFKAGQAAKVWPMSGNKYGQLESELTQGYATQIVDCTGTVDVSITARFCGDSAHYVAWPISELDGTGEMIERDVVIGIDDGGMLLQSAGTTSPVVAAQLSRQVVVIDPKRLALGSSLPGQSYAVDNPLSRMPDAVDTKLRVQSMVRVDLEGNGDALLAVSFIGAQSGEPIAGEVRLCEVDDDGVLESCPSLTSVIPALADWTCVDIAAAQLGARGHNLPLPASTDLAVLCHGKPGPLAQTRVFRVWFDSTSGTRVATPLLTLPQSPATRIHVGDVTGDRLDDLVLLLPELGNPMLGVFPQCEASDLECIYPLCAADDLACFGDAPGVQVGSK